MVVIMSGNEYGIAPNCEEANLGKVSRVGKSDNNAMRYLVLVGDVGFFLLCLP